MVPEFSLVPCSKRQSELEPWVVPDFPLSKSHNKKRPYIKSCLVGRRQRKISPGGEVFVSLSAASYQTRSLRPYHQTKQPTWNPTNHTCRPSTADANFQQITASLSFKQHFSRLNLENLKLVLLRANFRNSLRITSGLLTTPPMADTTRRRRNSHH